MIQATRNHLMKITTIPLVSAFPFIAFLAAPTAWGVIIQTNTGTGDGSIPGGSFEPTGNLLTNHLVSATRTGSFYREDSGYTVDLARLGDGDLGPAGTSGLGGDGRYTVMPGTAVIQFNFDAAYDLTRIRSYASWDDGRSGQSYTVKYATAADPFNFVTLYALTPFNNAESIFPLREDYDWQTDQTIMVPDTSVSSTMVELSSSSGFLATDVVSLQFVFSGYQNGGTAFREIQVTAVPEPASALFCGLGMLGLLRRRRA